MPLMPRNSEMDVKQALRDYDAGKYVHIPQTDDGPLNGTYGETAIPEKYIKPVWTRWYRNAFSGNINNIDQNVIYAKESERCSKSHVITNQATEHSNARHIKMRPHGLYGYYPKTSSLTHLVAMHLAFPIS